MLKRIAFALLAAAALLLLATPAFAQTPPRLSVGDCKPHALLLAELAVLYGERTVLVGASDSGRVLEVLAAPDGSWTMLMVLPDGTACASAFGEGLEITPLPVPGKET